MGRIKSGRRRRTPRRYKGDNYIPEHQRNVWLEYGTLANRAPWHRFLHGRLPKSARWRGGIKPRATTERAWASTEAEVMSRLEAEVKRRAEQWNQRNRATV